VPYVPAAGSETDRTTGADVSPERAGDPKRYGLAANASRGSSDSTVSVRNRRRPAASRERREDRSDAREDLVME